MIVTNAGTVKDHIIKLVGVFMDPNNGPRLVLEPSIGALGRRRRVQKLNAGQTSALLSQALLALAYLHDPANHAGRVIVHWDLRPENFSVTSLQPFHVKLTGFGSAVRFEEALADCEPDMYTAPEIRAHLLVNPNGVPDGSSLLRPRAVDIWSLGVIILQQFIELKYVHSENLQWCQQVVAELQKLEAWRAAAMATGNIDRTRSNTIVILNGMIRMAPVVRADAASCLRMLQNLASSVERT